MTYKIEIKGDDKETSAEIEDLKELKKNYLKNIQVQKKLRLKRL